MAGKRNCDEALILALAGGADVAGAARKAGVSERTVRRRLEGADFRARVDGVRSELVRQAVGKLAEAGGLASSNLRALEDSAKSEAVRLGACRAVLEFMFRGHELDTLARQVEELRREVQEVSRGAGGAPSCGAAGNGSARGAAGRG